MKKFTFAIPCYNSAAYMDHAIESILSCLKDDMEIILVDDGSTKDNTAEIADAWAEKYPGTIRVIHQENAGHGGAVAAGIAAAEGEYFKVVDSDDWLDEEALPRVLDRVRSFENPVDMVVFNYIYDKVGATHKKVVRYTLSLPTDRVLSWDDVRRPVRGAYILMHSVMYRTEVIRKSGLELPKHTFYVDNLFVTVPMRMVESIYYMNEDVYHYFIGRDDQSVHESVMIKRMDQQLRVNLELVKQTHLSEIEHKMKYLYIYSYVEIITTVSMMMILLSDTEENYEKRAKLWKDIRREDEAVYRKLRFNFLTIMTTPVTRVGRKVTIAVYHFLQKFVGFN